eukprot:389432_1
MVVSSRVNKENEAFSTWLISICIIFPFLFLIYYILKAIKMMHSIPKEQNVAQRELRIKKLKSRAFIGVGKSENISNEKDVGNGKLDVLNIDNVESKVEIGSKGNVEMVVTHHIDSDIDIIYEKHEMNVEKPEKVDAHNNDLDTTDSSSGSISSEDSAKSEVVMAENKKMETKTVISDEINIMNEETIDNVTKMSVSNVKMIYS